MPQTNLVATQPLSAAPTKPPGSVVSGVVSGVLGLAGLGPLAPDSPTTPVDSPMEWAVVALVRSRRFGQAVTEEASNLPSSPTLTSQTIDGLVTGDLTAAGDQGDRQALADPSITALSASVTIDVASAATTSTTTFAQVKAAAPQTQQSGGPGGDTTAPTVSLTAPAAGATVSGTVTVSANASDNKGVVGVQFKLDGNFAGRRGHRLGLQRVVGHHPVANGSHTLTAVARDAAGNTTTSTAVTVTVNNPDTTAPTVSLTAPAAGATVSGTVTVTATASDNVGVAGVQFKLDGTSLGAEDTAAPYSVSWDTTQSPTAATR